MIESIPTVTTPTGTGTGRRVTVQHADPRVLGASIAASGGTAEDALHAGQAAVSDALRAADVDTGHHMVEIVSAGSRAVDGFYGADAGEAPTVRRTQKQLDDLHNSTGDYAPNPTSDDLPEFYEPNPPECGDDAPKGTGW